MGKALKVMAGVGAAIEHLTFEGYDPASPTLRRGRMEGGCLDSLIDRKFGTCYSDELPVYSGDFVVLTCRNRHGRIGRMVKQLRCTRDGKWWAHCDDATFQIGRAYRPTAIHKVVALSTLDARLPVIGRRATADDIARLHRLAAPALAEWARDGVEIGTAFPGLHLLNIPDPASTDLPTAADAPGNGLGLSRRTIDICGPVELTVDTPEYDQPDAPISFTVTSQVKGVLLKWSAPAPVKRDQTYHVYEHTANTPFSSATRVWSGKAFSTLVNLTAGTTRYYWITSSLNGIESDAVPVGNGTSGTPGTAATGDIAANAATALAVTTEPADGSQVYASATQPVVGVVGLNGLASYTAIEETQVDVSWSAQARISNTTSGVAVGEARLQARVFINGSEVFSKRLILESYTGADSWGPFSGTRSFSVPAGQTIDAYIQTSRSFSTSGTSPAQTMYWRDALVNLVPRLR